MLSTVGNLRGKIFAKVLLFVCASIFVILFISFYLFDRIEYEGKKNDMISQQKFITQSQAIIIPQYLLDGDDETVTLAMSGILSNPTIIGVAVYGPDGEILHEFGRFDSDTYRTFKASHRITSFDGSKVVSLGRLVTVVTDKQIVENLEARREFYGLVFALLFVAIVIATYASIHLIVAIPLNRLVAAIKKSRAGEPIAVNWTSRDEIGLVVREFHSLQERQLADRTRLRTELDQRERILAELRIMKDAAEQASRAKSEFLATMGHELRTPLNAIIGFSEVIKSEAFGPVGVPRYLEFSDDIHRSGLHLLSIINDILDLSKIGAGELKPEETQCVMVRIGNEAVDEFSDAAEEKNLKFTVDIPETLASLLADERMVRQILSNILSNAVKFTAHDGQITLSAIIDEDGFLISVTDTGIGISADKMEIVLEPFRQADGRLERQYDGAGLGLALVKSMMELHGGKIAIDSTPDVGTTVKLRFPPARVQGNGTVPAVNRRIA